MHNDPKLLTVLLNFFVFNLEGTFTEDYFLGIRTSYPNLRNPFCSILLSFLLIKFENDTSNSISHPTSTKLFSSVWV